MFCVILAGLTLGALGHVAVQAQKNEVAVKLGRAQATYETLLTQRRHRQIENRPAQEPGPPRRPGARPAGHDPRSPPASGWCRGQRGARGPARDPARSPRPRRPGERADPAARAPADPGPHRTCPARNAPSPSPPRARHPVPRARPAPAEPASRPGLARPRRRPPGTRAAGSPRPRLPAEHPTRTAQADDRRPPPGGRHRRPEDPTEATRSDPAGSGLPGRRTSRCPPAKPRPPATAAETPPDIEHQRAHRDGPGPAPDGARARPIPRNAAAAEGPGRLRPPTRKAPPADAPMKPVPGDRAGARAPSRGIRCRRCRGSGAVISRWTRLRMVLFGALVALGALAIARRAFVLQVEQADLLRERAEDQSLREIQVRPQRGRILDRKGHELASTAELDSVSCNPRVLMSVAGRGQAAGGGPAAGAGAPGAHPRAGQRGAPLLRLDQAHGHARGERARAGPGAAGRAADARAGPHLPAEGPGRPRAGPRQHRRQGDRGGGAGVRQLPARHARARAGGQGRQRPRHVDRRPVRPAQPARRGRHA